MRENTGVISMGLAPAARMPLRARLRLLAEPTLGVGSFLDHARAVSPDPSAPFLLAQHAGGPEEDGLERLSLDRLTEIRDAYASWYHEAGVRKGDPVGVYAGEGIDAFLHFLALSSLGAIAALVNGRMKPAVAAEYLTRIGVYGLVGTAEGIDRLRESGGLPKTLAFEKDLRTFPRTRSARPSLPGVFPYRHGEDDLVMLCHTSGTTGPPKAVTFGHRQFFRGKRHRLVSFPDAGSNRMLSALPQTHSAGISYLMTATLLGLPTLVMADSSGEAVHDAAGWFRPTLVVAFPQTYAELARLDLSPSAVGNVHTWINTGDSAHEAHIKALIRHGRRPGGRSGRLPVTLPGGWPGGRSSRAGSRFIDGLGSSEMGMALFRKVSEPERQDYDRCVGRPVKVVERATVLDPDGRQLGPGRAGRLGVISPTRTPGYWGNTELTGKSSVSGFWLTGDIVYRDRRGRFFHLDRVPDVIETAEGPVYSLPMEEAILLGLPEVADCAVVAVDAPPPLGKQAPFATVLLKPGAKAPADLLATLNDVLRARGLTSLSAAVLATEPEHFPTGATGKVLKRSLREHFADVLVRPSSPGTEESSS
ncbi:acyl--CoA ligase [Streptomyces griseus]|uniref:class I adenylate-forming enzyme family protein n=1 Tax=Streptomyces TaxID=1883 RepID=UPI0029C2E406|nr:class I adenylate-forming enzyme family protein [Streptomyces sp. ID01-9D]MDX5575304.1 class I adenylate-forming enzyme family protein [Streptomyces sp. ID01-9D]WSV21005.1 acyl--CoA ligase [Streptomyces fimicarius]WTC90112.1 acyl--CoA ligase [Streptomyces griseus]WTD67259.1 acyl--CoA ligase [Streptomyces griseus]